MRQPVANTKLTELLRCTSTCLQNHTSSLLPLSSLSDKFWRMSLHPEQADEHPSTHIMMFYSLCITDASHNIKKWLRGTAKVSLVSIFLHKAPNPNPQPAKYSPATVGPDWRLWRCGISLLQPLVARCWSGWPFSGRDQHLEALIYHGVKVVILLSFQYDGHDLLTNGNDLVFRRLHTSGPLTECFIRFYKFQSSCFPYHK